MQVVLEQEEAVRHDVGGDEGAGEDREAEGSRLGGGPGGGGVADKDGGEGGEDGGRISEVMWRWSREKIFL